MKLQKNKKSQKSLKNSLKNSLKKLNCTLPAGTLQDYCKALTRLLQAICKALLSY
jgi:hypothetical protein